MQKTQTDWCNSVLMFKNTVPINRRKKETEYEHLQYCSYFCLITPLALQYCAHIAPNKYKKYTSISIRKHWEWGTVYKVI